MENVLYFQVMLLTVGLQGVGIEDGAPDVDADEGDEDIAGEWSPHGLDRTLSGTWPVPIYHHDTEEAEADLESDEEYALCSVFFSPILDT